jgi:hypothetical protein
MNALTQAVQLGHGIPAMSRVPLFHANKIQRKLVHALRVPSVKRFVREVINREGIRREEDLPRPRTHEL